jgi:hypothetical protein
MMKNFVCFPLLLRTASMLAAVMVVEVRTAAAQDAPRKPIPAPVTKSVAREAVLLPVQALPLPEVLGFKDINPGLMPEITQSVILSREPGTLPSTHQMMYGERLVTMTFSLFASAPEAKQGVAEAHKRAKETKMVVATELLESEGTEKFAFGVLNLRTIIGRKHNVQVSLECDRRDIPAEDLGKLYDKVIDFLDGQAALLAKAGEMREWQNQSGQKIRAKLLKYDATRQMVDLQLENGQISKNVSKDKFSEADQEFLVVFGTKEPEPK